MKKQSYAMKVSTLLNAAEMLSDDLNYLSSLVENPDPEFLIKDAVVYSQAITCISSQLNFIIEDLTQNDLSDDQEHVKLSQDEVFMLSSFAESTEESLYELEKVCGISLRNN